MSKYLVHAVGMFPDFKHYHISFVDNSDYVSLYTWEAIATEKINRKTLTPPDDVYIVGYTEIN